MKLLPIRQRLTTRHLLVLFPLGLVFALALRPIDETDLWWHLKAGEWMLQHRAIPRTGLWSWIAESRPWITHEWLFEVCAAALHRLAGPMGLIVAKALCITAAFAFVLRHARLRSGSAGLCALLVLVGAIISSPFWSERPQVITFAFAAFFLLALDRWERGERRSLWVLAPLVVVWANFHAAYITAFLLLALYAAAQVLEQGWARWRGQAAEWGKARHLGLVAGASALGALINPHGVEILIYPFRYLRFTALTRFVAEWSSPNFHDARMQAFALFLLATLAVLALSPLRPRPARMLLSLFLAVLALFSIRNMPLMVIGFVPLMAEHLRPLWDGVPAARAAAPARPAREVGQVALLNWVLLGILVLFIVACIPPPGKGLTVTEGLPVKAVRHLKQHPMPGRMLNFYDWGGYLIWELSPQYKVFIDGRSDVFGQQIMEDVGDVFTVKRNWRQVLDKYDIDWVLWRRDRAFAQLLYVSPEWQVSYEDDLAVIFTRKP